MSSDELKRYIKVGRERSITIYCELCDEYLGYVKTVTIMDEALVRIEYNVWNYDEAGPTYFIQYDDLEGLITSLQEYLGKNINEWKNINQTGYYPQALNIDYDLDQSHKLIEQDIMDHKISLPQYGKVEMKKNY